MSTYVVQRIITGLLTMFIASIVVFLLIRVVPGNVALAMLGDDPETIRQEDVDALEEKLGLNEPLYVQYLDWMTDAAQLDFGDSLWTGRSVTKELERRLPITLELTGLAVVMGVAFGVPLGLIAAVKHGSWIDGLVRSAVVTGLVVPGFFLGILVLLFLIRFANWSPPVEYHAPWQNPMANFEQMIWPALVLSAYVGGIIGRMVRSTMVDVMSNDYIRTARAKGLPGQSVWIRHGLRNAFLPVFTLATAITARLIAGAVTIEIIFNVPGIGGGLVNALNQRDYVMVQGVVFVTVALVVLVNLITDLCYGFFDPRLRTV